MLKTRLMTGSALLAIFIPFFFVTSSAVLSFALAVLLSCAAWEWARLLKLEARHSLVYAFSTGGISILILNAPYSIAFSLYFSTAAFWLGMVPWMLVRQPSCTSQLWRVFLGAMGPLVLMAGAHALLSARAISSSFAFSILLLIWAADSGAYFIGKKFGKHKLVASISPGKSWEGALGGALCGYAAACVMQRFEPSLLSMAIERWGQWGAWSVLMALVALSIMGDLFESFLKRRAGVKDSSALLPGHGGVLDRIDALLPVLPLTLLLLNLY